MTKTIYALIPDCPDRIVTKIMRQMKKDNMKLGRPTKKMEKKWPSHMILVFKRD